VINRSRTLARHPRFHIHFTPTGSSWMNLIERFFADITQDAIPTEALAGCANSSKQLRNIFRSARLKKQLSINHEPFVS
jgi:hypothetical protein